MNVLITGGAGYIGTAVTTELAAAGHAVNALVRTAAQEDLMRAIGGIPIRGDLAEPLTYRAAAAAADVIVNLAAPRGADGSRAALHALLDAARRGRARQFIHTSVLFVLGDVPAGADENAPYAGDLYADRAALERDVLSDSSSALACSVIRPAMVYGGGAGGTISELFRGASQGVVQYIGRGENRWSLVHRSDVASLFRLVIEKQATGILHAAEDGALRVRDVAQLIAAAAGDAAIDALALEEARALLGRFADALCLDQPVRASRARALGWDPRWSFTTSVAAAHAEFKQAQSPGA